MALRMTCVVSAIILGFVWFLLIPQAADGSRSCEHFVRRQLGTEVPAFGDAELAPAASMHGVPYGAERQEANVVIVQAAWEDGGPLARAEVRAFSGSGTCRQSTTDERGEVRLVELVSPVVLLLNPREGPPFVVELPALDDRLCVIVPMGERVSGTLSVDSETQRRPVEVLLVPDDPSNLLTDIVPSVPAAVAWDALGAGVMRAFTDSAGGFEFRGLKPTFSGTLQLRPGASLLDDAGQVTEEIRVDAPHTGIALRAARWSRVHGIVRLAGTEAQTAAGRSVDLFDHRKLPPQIDGLPARTGDDGRFEFDILLEREIELGFEFRCQDARGSLRELRQVSPSADVDLGVFEVPEARSLAVHAVSADGRDIPGANIAIADVRGRKVGGIVASDATGRATIRAFGTIEAILATSPGHVPTRVPVPADPSVEVTVVLERTTLLAIRADGKRASADADLGQDLHVRISASEMPIKPLPKAFGRRPDAASLAASEFRFRDGTYRATQAVPRSEQILLSGVRPGIPLRIEPVDRWGMPSGEPITVSLERGEHRVLEIAPAASMARQQVTVEVRDSLNHPIPEATVAPGDTGRSFETDSAGRCIIDGVGASIEFEVSATGHQPLKTGPIAVSKSINPLILTLER